MRLLMLACVGLLATLATAHAEDGGIKFRVHTINAGSTYSAAAVFDVNRDGKLDIVSGGWWYEAPKWKRHFLREVEEIRGRFDDYSNLPIDVNGDGWLDLVSANYRSSKLYWIEHPGKKLGRWTTHEVAKPGPMETARLVDVDGDGRLDVLPNGVRFAAWWEIGEKDGKWTRHELPAEVAGHGIGFGDINGDGRGDIVSVNGWLEAPVDRRRERWRWHPEFQLHRDGSVPMLVFDVDSDGDNDIVWSAAHHTGLHWLEQVTSKAESRIPVREWRFHTIDTSWSQAHSLLLGDLNNDGKPEVIAGKRYMGHDGKDPGEYNPMIVAAYSFQPKSKTFRRSLISNGWKAGFGLDPKLVDLDGDADLDLIGPGRSGLYWFENLHKQSAASLQAEKGHWSRVLADTDHTKLLHYVAGKDDNRPVKTPADWAHRREHILAHMQTVMGYLPDPSLRVPLDVKVLEEVTTEKYVRQKVTFASEPGDRVPAYLLIPRNLKAKAPAMLCLHQTTGIGKGEPAGLGGRPTLHYAHELANRGYVCIVPDYPSFGDYQYDFAQRRESYTSGSMKAIWNNLRAVDLLESLPQVDKARIGCIGHSLGGHNSLFTSVFDLRIRAVVTSCGFTAFHHYYGGKLKGWTSNRYMPRINDVYGNDPDRVPFDFYEIIAALAPRGVFVNAPLEDSNFDVGGVRKVIAEASKVYGLLGAKENLRAVYPDSKHDFPDAIRKAAYDWLDQQLK